MPETVIPDSLSPLCAGIEALALEVTLGDFSSVERLRPLGPMLARIGEDAARAGVKSVADIAIESARAVENARAADAARIEPALRDAVARMQQLVTASNPAAILPEQPMLAIGQDPELIADFIMESREHLTAAEAQLLALEHNPENGEAINTIFRAFHTIKGLAGFLDFPAIQDFAHEVETLLDMARNGTVPVHSTLIDIILQSTDYMGQCLDGVETGRQPEKGPAELLARIRQTIAGDSVVEAAADAAAEGSLMQLAAAVATPARENKPAASGEGHRAVKVDTGKLDRLVEMVGEMVIAQSQVQHDPEMTKVRSSRLTRNLSQLTRITLDVQRVAMTMRMVPVAQMFQRLSRLVRDLARKSGKQVQLELSGEDTELDRNLVEEVADPLMHMIRNAVDHGAEPPAARVAAGKNPVARIDLRASYQGGFIKIEIADDGRGLVREKILKKARERGLVTNGDELTEQEVFGLIFEPGFSTADQVTDVSGRGVGMDVVRKQIMKLRGRVDIASREGFGTTFSIKLPLTLAIIDGLVVGVGSERYVVPIFAVKEIFRPAAEAVSSLPEAGEMILVRGGLLPIVRLHRRFGVTPRSEEPSEGVIIVVESADTTFALLVDELIGKQEVVIKNLGDTFKHVSGVSGGSILGDGTVGLILDMETVFGNAVKE